MRWSLSTSLNGVHSSVMGLYDAGFVVVLLGLRSVMILPIFQSEGIMQYVYEKDYVGECCDAMGTEMFNVNIRDLVMANAVMELSFTPLYFI